MAFEFSQSGHQCPRYILSDSTSMLRFLCRAWLSLVEHSVRDRGVGGSNPLAPTNFLKKNHRRDLNGRSDAGHFAVRGRGTPPSTSAGQRSNGVMMSCCE